MFKRPETFRASAPGKFETLAGATAAREEACHPVRVTSTGRKQVGDSVPGPLERDVSVLSDCDRQWHQRFGRMCRRAST